MADRSQRGRPLVRYHGGKWRLAPWIISNLPTHRVYVEPFGGGASVLLRKPRAYGEIYNDLDGEIVNLFRVARDRGDELIRLLRLTPFARAEFELSYRRPRSRIERARRTLVRSFQGFGSAAVCGEVSGFRANSNRSGTTPAHDWRNYPDALERIIDRLQGVVIEQRDAVEVMRAHDAEDALHYLDPPYVHATRSEKRRNTVTRKEYKHEMADADHIELARVLRTLRGAVVLSGYPCDLYRELYRDWVRVAHVSHADGARARVECLWFNDAAQAGRASVGLFDRSAADA